LGGGTGAFQNETSNNGNGYDGGSGGGGSYITSGDLYKDGGAGLQPDSTYGGFGNSGAKATSFAGGKYGGGGGGAGQAASILNGGSGIKNPIAGSTSGQFSSGFYYIALKANVPIIPVAFDYSKKEVKIGTPFLVTGNYEADMKLILPHFKEVKGKFPERQFQV
jgi:hypothetical protein